MRCKFTKPTRLIAFMLAFAGIMTAWTSESTATSAGVVIVHENEFGADVQEPEINPDHIRWQNGEDFGDIIPEKYVYIVPPNHRAPRFPSASAVKYDPRDEDGGSNALTPAKDQGALGTCWAFAATGAFYGNDYGVHSRGVNVRQYYRRLCFGYQRIWRSGRHS